MKKILSLIILCAIIITAVPYTNAANIGVISGVKAADLRFTPDGDGKFIYCNNNEGIMRTHLSDTSNLTPEYIMNNTELEPDKYSMYMSFINRTETRFETTGVIDRQGFDIELDVELEADEDTTLLISALGFEVTSYDTYYSDGILTKEDRPWTCLNAVADYHQRTIKRQSSSVKFVPNYFTPVTINLKKGEAAWLSKYISNYSPVPWLKGVHMLADIEIVSGKANINVAALKSTEIVGDRSNHCKNAAQGKYYRDRQYKGIADTLPSVSSGELKYTISDSFVSGTLLPVNVYNQYQPDGNTVTKWMTNINPQEDKWSRDFSAESDMLGFTFKDDSKLSYYGSDIDKKSMDNIWKFDVFHSDTTNWDGEATGYKAGNYIPNYPLTTSRENSGYGCNLGNYGVAENYHISIDNTGSSDRYFNYLLKTTADIVVNIKDENGKYLNDYAVSKGGSETKTQDTLASVSLPAGAVTSFTIEVTLPTNCAGGTESSFTITDLPSEIAFSESTSLPYLKSNNFTGSEYYKWENGGLYTSPDKNIWTKKNINENTAKLFEGKWHNYEIVRTGTGYAARCNSYLYAPSLYSESLKYFNNVYFMDENFNIIGQKYFDGFPKGISYAAGKYYVETGTGSFYSEDGVNWREFAGGFTLPVSNGGSYAAAFKNKILYVTQDGLTYKPVHFTDNAPKYVDVIGKYYYYAEKDKLYLSENAIFWEEIQFADEITKVDLKNGNLYINDSERAKIPEFSNEIILDINNEIVIADAPPQITDGRTLVPARAILEKMGAKVDFNSKTRKVTAALNGITAQLTLDSTKAVVNSVEREMDVPATIINDRTMVPIRFLAENFNFNVGWDEQNRIVTVVKKATVNEPSSETIVTDTLPSAGVISNELSAVRVAAQILRSINENDIGLSLKAEFDEKADSWNVKNENGEIVLTMKRADGRVTFYLKPEYRAKAADNTLESEQA